MRAITISILLSALMPCLVSAQADEPIIDMHLHGAREVGSFRFSDAGTPLPRPCFPQPCARVPAIAQSFEDVQEQTLRYMDEYNIVLASLSDRPPHVQDWVQKSSQRIIPALGVFNSSHINVNEMREQFRSGDFAVLGEVGVQYAGIPIDDQSLRPMFAMAHELDIPVHIHSAGLGGGDGFPIHLGNPLRLSEVLREYPGLRIYLENASWPFLEEVTSLMYVHPTVYADLSTITWIIPRETFHNYLRALVENGLSKRLMFGSDQMMWPETIPLAIEAIESADFLSEQQKRDILYNNAARFLRLSEDEIAAHNSQR